MILDGKVVAASIKEQLKEEMDAAVANRGRASTSTAALRRK